jgi:MFS family permease
MSSPPPPTTKVLNRARLNFGLVNILSSGDESAFTPFHTVIVRALGGSDVQLGFIGAVMQSVGQMFAWIGAIVLRLTHFNRQALVAVLIAGAITQAAIVVLLVLAAKNSEWASACLYGYLALVSVMCALTGAQMTIITSWVGDLVPVRQRGWFVSGMAIISNIGLILLQMFFAYLAIRTEGILGYSALMGLLCVTTIAAIFLCYSIPNRRSLALKFVSRQPEEHVNYRYRPMWLLIWFECAWRIGRVAMGAFTTAYLLDYFGLKLDRIILIYMLVNVMNIFMLYVVGRVSDQVGNRYPLAIITCICAASMLLWVGSAWWGLWPIIAYQIINGMAGSTHWMLLTNLSLQVYPAKGRANFLSFSRTVVGVMLMAGATFAGYLMSLMRGWSITLWGADFNYYHVFFLGCTIFTFGCLIPLWFLGKMTMPTPEESIVTENGA